MTLLLLPPTHRLLDLEQPAAAERVLRAALQTVLPCSPVGLLQASQCLQLCQSTCWRELLQEERLHSPVGLLQAAFSLSSLPWTPLMTPAVASASSTAMSPEPVQSITSMICGKGGLTRCAGRCGCTISSSVQDSAAHLALALGRRLQASSACTACTWLATHGHVLPALVRTAPEAAPGSTPVSKMATSTPLPSKSGCSCRKAWAPISACTGTRLSRTQAGSSGHLCLPRIACLLLRTPGLQPQITTLSLEARTLGIALPNSSLAAPRAGMVRLRRGWPAA